MRRLILFDIDGTLLSTNGAARRAFHRALIEVFGTAGSIATHPFDGKTDPQIARELLNGAGMPDSVVDRELPVLWRAYLRELAIELTLPGHASTLLPGVAELLDALAARSHEAMIGLLTGNIERGAELKLASVGLVGRFATGAYGSDHEQRDSLPAVAIRRAGRLCGTHFQGRQVVIVGDTPHDVTCGQALGVHAVGVTTGRFDRAALAAAGAGVVLDDLSNTQKALDALFM